MNTLHGKTEIASHRGAASGNIPYNTMPAFECALLQKADIVELDVSKSKDGTLYVFHPKLEKKFLCSDRLISEMTDEEVDALRHYNSDQTVTEYKVERLEDVLRALRGRCKINIDKFWGAPLEIAKLVRELGMQDQVIVKSNLSAECARDAQEYAADMPYMCILKEKNTLGDYMQDFRGRWFGVEVCFSTEDAEVGTESFIQQMHDANKIVWVNALVYNYKKILAAGHSDDRAVAGDLQGGWGWLIDRGYDIIQTDFPLLLHTYMHNRKDYDK